MPRRQSHGPTAVRRRRAALLLIVVLALGVGIAVGATSGGDDEPRGAEVADSGGKRAGDAAGAPAEDAPDAPPTPAERARAAGAPRPPGGRGGRRRGASS